MSANVLDLDEIYQICEALYALTLVKKNNFGLDPVIKNAKKYMDLIERLQLEERGKMDTSTVRFEIVAQYKKWLKENFLMGDSPLTLLYFLDLNGMLDKKGCQQFVDMIKKGGSDE